MTARTVSIISWTLAIVFLTLLAWVIFVFLTTPDTREPVEPKPQPDTCQEVKPEVPAELPKTGVSL